MKKLMVILGIALMTSAASAATVLWSASENFADSDGVAFTDSRNITAYLFDAATVSQSDLFDSWKAGTADVSGAKVTSTWYDAYEQDVTAAIGTSGTKSLYWAVINGDDLFISSTIEKEISSIGLTTYTWADESGAIVENASAFGSAGWYTTSSVTPPTPGPSGVPEPTSGLLLLLGVAGLALKRKVA